MLAARCAAAPAGVAARLARIRLTARQRLVTTVTALVAGIWLILDQATKHAAVQALESPGRVIDLGVVDLRVIRNPNAAFSIPAEVIPGLFVIVTVVVIVLVLRALPHTDHLGLAAAYGLVTGGALGNCMDRILRYPGFPSGHVVDFVDLGWFPVFNVADAGIVLGAVGVALLMLASDARERRRGGEPGGSRGPGAAERSQASEASARHDPTADEAAPSAGTPAGAASERS